MMPIRSAPLRLIRRLGASLLLVVLAGATPEPAVPGPLKGVTVEQFRDLLASRNDPTPRAEDAGPALVAYRRKMRRSVQDIGSLGDMFRIQLLSSDWAAGELDLVSPAVTLEKIESSVLEKAAHEEDDAQFQRSIRGWMASTDETYRDYVTRSVVSAIKRDARRRLQDRLIERTRHYLREARPEDRIAAANLITDTMMVSQRQQRTAIIDFEADKKRANRQNRFLEKGLGQLSDDVRRLLGDANPQVQVAGIRALSSLEIPPSRLAAALKPLLSSPTNVVVRRAAARGLARLFQDMAKEPTEVVTLTLPQLDKSQPEPLVDKITHILPVAIVGVRDSDADVRLASLEAIRSASEVLQELTDAQVPEARKKRVEPALRVVEQALPILNNVAARDSQPGLRVVACRVLESLVLVRMRVRGLPGALPAPKYEQKLPELPLPNPDREPRKGKKGVSLPSRSGGRRSLRKEPSQWAAGRTETSGVLILPPVPLVHDSASSSDVALDRPVKLTPEPRAQATVRPASFLAPQMDELPSPRPVDNPWKDTVKAMIDDLRDPDYRVRLQAVGVLETFGDQAEPAIPALVRALCDSNKFVRWSSARTLGRFATRANQAENEAFFKSHAGEVVPGLVGLLNDREDPSVRLNAARALAEYGVHAGKAVPELAHVINRGGKDFILAILNTIQSIGTDAAPTLPNVAWLMSDRTQPTSVRVAAGQTITRFGRLAGKQPRVREVLRDLMLNDPNEAVRDAASNALLAIDRPME